MGTEISCAIGLALGTLYFFLAGTPMAFLKGATLRLNVQDADAPLAVPQGVGSDAWDAVVAIPTPPMDVPWWNPAAIVDPDALLRYTLLEGAGNCAAKCRGLGWLLGKRSIPFRFVYVMDDPDVRLGDAHTMVETSWTWEGAIVTGILDPLAAGVPTVDGKPLSLKRLIEGRDGLDVRYVPDRPDIEKANLRSYHVFRAGDRRRSAFIAVSRGDQVLRHLRLMSAFSKVLPDSFPSRAAGILMSILVGTYPSVEVPVGESKNVSALLRTDGWIARSMVWCARLLILSGALRAVMWGARRVSRGLARVPAR